MSRLIRELDEIQSRYFDALATAGENACDFILSFISFLIALILFVTVPIWALPFRIWKEAHQASEEEVGGDG